MLPTINEADFFLIKNGKEIRNLYNNSLKAISNTHIMFVAAILNILSSLPKLRNKKKILHKKSSTVINICQLSTTKAINMDI